MPLQLSRKSLQIEAERRLRRRASPGRSWTAQILAGLALSAVSLVATPSYAQDGPLSSLQLDWPTVDGCPTRDDVYFAILRHLGAAAGHTNAIAATVTIEHATAYRLTLFTRSKTGSGTRELNGDTCRSVTDVAVIILAMMLGDDGLVTGNADPSDAQQPIAIAAPIATPSPVVSQVILAARDLQLGARKPRRHVPMRAGVGTWLPIGIARTSLYGVVASGGLDIGAWRVVAQLGWAPKRRLELASGAGSGASVTMFMGAFSAGPVVRLGRWDFVPRLGLSEHVLYGTGYGVDNPLSRSAYFASFRAGALLELQLSRRFLVQTITDVVVPMQRPGLLLYPGGEVLRPAHLGFDASLSMAMRF